MTAPPFSWSDTLGRITAGEDIDRVTAHAAMSEVMHGRATQAQISAFIVSLRMKGESVEEMTGFVEAMREVAVTVDVDVPVVDTVGTGGDRSGTFNISTTAGLIAAGAGVFVAKHGNRSSSSQCGSADVLEALGMQIDLDPEAMATLVREERFGFFFAPLYHPSMRHAGPARRELGIPTVFNFLGPLANPAGATRQAVGVSDARMAAKMIGVLNNLGSDYAFVFYGEDGLDELTTTGPSYIYRLRNGEITHAEFTPEDFGVPRARLEDLLGGDADTNAAITRGILAGAPGTARDIAVVNAAPAIVIAGLAHGFEEATAVAAQSIDSGAAAGVLERVIQRSRELKR
jgi:anthranilate phosphoribosyltransferase